VRLAALLEDGAELNKSYQTMLHTAKRLAGDTTRTTWLMTGSPRSNFSVRRRWKSEKVTVKDRFGDCGVKQRDSALQLACWAARHSVLVQVSKWKRREWAEVSVPRRSGASEV
jgi:hypothetical protein